MEELAAFLQEKGLTLGFQQSKCRCLVTLKDFQPGEEITSEEPYACTPYKSRVKSVCHRCFKLDDQYQLKVCVQCKFARYCGSTCQKLDWKLHKPECRALSRKHEVWLWPESVTPSIRFMVKLCLRKLLQSQGVIPTTAADNFGLVESLVPQMTIMNQQKLGAYADRANTINLLLKDQHPEISRREIIEKFCQVSSNMVRICDSHMNEIGKGLYPIIALINHSCLPNAVLVFEGRVGIVRAIKPIPKGTEVLISYLDLADIMEAGQEELQYRYHFVCTCHQCCEIARNGGFTPETVIHRSYKCKDEQCKGVLPRDSEEKVLECTECGRKRKLKEIRRILGEISYWDEKANCLESCHKYEEAFSAFKMIEKLHMKLYPPLSVRMMRARINVQERALELIDWKQAIEYCKMNIPAYERIYPEFHPTIGMQYFNCGKLERFVGDKQSAVTSLSKALSIIEISHGKDSTLTKEIIEIMEEVQAQGPSNVSPTNE